MKPSQKPMESRRVINITHIPHQELLLQDCLLLCTTVDWTANTESLFVGNFIFHNSEMISQSKLLNEFENTNIHRSKSISKPTKKSYFRHAKSSKPLEL